MATVAQSHRRPLALFVIALPFTGCGAPLAGSARLERARHAVECARVPQEVREVRRAEGSEPQVLTAELPEDVRRVAVAARFDDEQLADRTHVLERVLLLRSEVDAVSAEISCLDDQLEALQDALEDQVHRFELSFTVSSIALGAIAAVAAGILDLVAPDSPGSAIAGIIGGVGSAGLGLAAFLSPTETVELKHNRNLLRATRQDADTTDGTLPRFITRLLHAPRADGTSPRDRIQAGWDEVFHGIAPATTEVFFGNGGAYDLAMLGLRERAIETLEIEIELVRQDIELLLRHLYQHR